MANLDMIWFPGYYVVLFAYVYWPVLLAVLLIVVGTTILLLRRKKKKEQQLKENHTDTSEVTVDDES
ncbi:MAG: hypothetical protein IJ960_00035 [Oscillospiraceae bacterium]|nr:hypothetical protein [Oscillospiraceae bacterium]